MDGIKQELQLRFQKALENLDLSKDDCLLELQFNSIAEELFEYTKRNKKKNSVPFHQTSNQNICSSEFGLCSGKSDDVVLQGIPTSTLNETKQSTPPTQTTIPNNFQLNYEMINFAKSKYIHDVEEVFENFKLYYQSKGTPNANWEAAWKKWVLNQSKFKNHLIKTTINENLELSDHFIKIAKNFIPKDMYELEFTKFKNFYLSRGDLSASWERTWENWCINFKQSNLRHPNQQIQEKQTYKWNFKKAKDTSDKIKDWLEFEVQYNWLDLHFNKGENSFKIKTRQDELHIGISKTIHPDFNKEEILLFRVQSDDGKYILEHSPNDVIDIEIIDND